MTVVGTKGDFWWLEEQWKANPLSSLSFLLFPRAVGKFLVGSELCFALSSQSNWPSITGHISLSWHMVLPGAQLSWQFYLQPSWTGRWFCPKLSPRFFSGKPQSSILSPDSMLGTVGSLVHSSPFVWNPWESNIGNYWWQLQFCILFVISRQSLFLRFAGSVFSPVQGCMGIGGGVHRAFSWPRHSNISWLLLIH